MFTKYKLQSSIEFTGKRQNYDRIQKRHSINTMHSEGMKPNISGSETRNMYIMQMVGATGSARKYNKDCFGGSKGAVTRVTDFFFELDIPQNDCSSVSHCLIWSIIYCLQYGKGDGWIY